MKNKFKIIFILLILFTSLFADGGRKYEHVDTIDVLYQLWPSLVPDDITRFGECSDSGSIDTIFSKVYMVYDTATESCNNILNMITAPGGSLYLEYFDSIVYTDTLDTIPAEHPYIWDTHSSNQWIWAFVLGLEETAIIQFFYDSTNTNLLLQGHPAYLDTFTISFPYVKLCDSTVLLNHVGSCYDSIIFDGLTHFSNYDISWAELDSEIYDSTYDTVVVTYGGCSDTMKLVNPLLHFHFEDSSLFTINDSSNLCDNNLRSRPEVWIDIGTSGGTVNDEDSFYVQYKDTVVDTSSFWLNLNDTLLIPIGSSGAGSTYCLEAEAPLQLSEQGTCNVISLNYGGCLYLDTSDTTLKIQMDNNTIACNGGTLSVGTIDSNNILNGGISYNDINDTTKSLLLLDVISGSCGDTVNTFPNITTMVFDTSTFTLASCGDGIVYIKAESVSSGGSGGTYTGSAPIVISSNTIYLRYNEHFFGLLGNNLTWEHNFVSGIYHYGNSDTDSTGGGYIDKTYILKESNPIGRLTRVGSNTHNKIFIDSLFLRYDNTYLETTATGHLTVQDIDGAVIEDGSIDSVDLSSDLDSAIFMQWYQIDTCKEDTVNLGYATNIYIDTNRTTFRKLSPSYPHNFYLSPKISKTTITYDNSSISMSKTNTTTCASFDSTNYHIMVRLANKSGLKKTSSGIMVNVGNGLSISNSGTYPLEIDTSSTIGADDDSVFVKDSSLGLIHLTGDAITTLVDSNDIYIVRGSYNYWFAGSTINLNTPLKGLEFDTSYFNLRSPTHPGDNGYIEITLNTDNIGGVSYGSTTPIDIDDGNNIVLMYDSCLFKTVDSSLSINKSRETFVNVFGANYAGGSFYTDSNGPPDDGHLYRTNMIFSLPFHVKTDSIDSACFTTWFDTITFAYDPTIFTIDTLGDDSLFTLQDSSIKPEHLSSITYDSICSYVTENGCGGGAGSPSKFVMFPEFRNMTVLPDPPSNGDLFVIQDQDFGSLPVNAYEWIASSPSTQTIRMSFSHTFTAVNESLYVTIRHKNTITIILHSAGLYDITNSSNQTCDTTSASVTSTWKTDTIVSASIQPGHNYYVSVILRLLSNNNNGTYIDMFEMDY